jgi:hypothetical protein
LLAILRPWISAGAFAPPAWPWAAAGFLLAVAAVSFSISRRDPWPWRGICVQGQSAVLLGVCLPLIAAGVLGSVALAQLQVRLANFWNELPDSILDVRYALLLAPGACYFAAWALGWSIAQWLNHRDQLARKLPCVPAAQFMLHAAREGLVHLICAAVALAVGTVLLLKFNQVVYFSEFRSANVVRIATFGMPVLLAIFGVSITLMTGLVGRMYGDESREWWARQSAWTTICALSWLLLFGCVFYLPPLLHWAWATYLHATIATGAMTSILTLLGLKAGSGKATGMTVGARGKEMVALLAPYGFTVLAIAALSAAMQSQVAPVPAAPSEIALSLADYLDLYTDSSSARGNIAEGQHMPALLSLPGHRSAAVVAGGHQQVFAVHDVPAAPGAGVFWRQHAAAGAPSIHRVRPRRRSTAGRPAAPAGAGRPGGASTTSISFDECRRQPGWRQGTGLATAQGGQLRVFAGVLRLRAAPHARYRRPAVAIARSVPSYRTLCFPPVGAAR